MTRSIPAYLVALAVGDLVSAEIGPRSRVWAEPAVLEAAKGEFEGVTEKFLEVGEELYGPYVWGTYDILVMPPGTYVKPCEVNQKVDFSRSDPTHPIQSTGFPFGGMENPLVTFLTPCLIVGDRSLVDVVAHEM